MNSAIQLRKPLTVTRKKLETVFREGLHEYWREYLHWRKKIIKNGSQKAVHKMRTSIRKELSLLSSLNFLTADKWEKKFRSILKRELKCLSAVRDAQVEQGRLSKVLSPILKTKKFAKYLRLLEKKRIKGVKKHYKKWGTKAQTQCIRKIDGYLTNYFSKASHKDLEETLFEIKKIVANKLKKIKKEKADLKVGDDSSFHVLRIDVKDLDYKIKLLENILVVPSSVRKQIRNDKLKLGNLQDEVELYHNAKGLFRKSLKHPHPRRELKAKIEKRQKLFLR